VQTTGEGAHPLPTHQPQQEQGGRVTTLLDNHEVLIVYWRGCSIAFPTHAQSTPPLPTYRNRKKEVASSRCWATTR
jgi:hypothetical protein